MIIKTWKALSSINIVLFYDILIWKYKIQLGNQNLRLSYAEIKTWGWNWLCSKLDRKDEHAQATMEL